MDQINILRSFIYKPKSKKINAQVKPLPAVYFIQGYTCGSVDFSAIPNLTIRQVLASFVERGFIVYRQEKFGVGDSSGPTQCSQVDFAKELTGFKAGLEYLKKQDKVDSENIHLFGHSLGGLFAPLLAKDNSIKSVIAYGAVVKPWYEYLQDIYSKQALIFGTDKKQAEENRKLVQPFLFDWLKTNKTMAEIRKDKSMKPVFESELLPISGDQIFHRHYSFFRSMSDFDFAKAWQEVKVPVLAVHGEYDIQAIDDQWTIDILDAVNKNGKKLAQRVIIPKAEHSMMTYPSMEKLLEAMREGKHNPANPGDNYSSEVADAVGAWLIKHR